MSVRFSSPMVFNPIMLLFFSVQFKCDNGRIILPLKTHEWNKSAVSNKFALISSSEFVAKSDMEQSHPFSQVPAASTQKSHPPAQSSDRSLVPHSPSRGEKHKHSVNDSRSPTPASTSSGHSLSTTSPVISTCISESQSPSKRCKYIKESIDEAIERCKKGKETNKKL